MLSVGELEKLVRDARGKSGRRNFTQAFELYIVLDSRRVRKEDVQLNEIIRLPHSFAEPAKIAFIGGGDLALRARDANVDTIIGPDDIDRLSTNKREARKLVRSYDFFIAEAQLMPRIGRLLGRFLGPRGKMPTPLVIGAPVKAIVDRLRSSVRIRVRGQYSLSVKIGDENMGDREIAENAAAVLNAIKDKIPLGEKAIRKVVVKTTMGEPVEQVLVVKHR